MRIKNIRRQPDDGTARVHDDLDDLAREIEALLPDGAQFATVVLLPGGNGWFVASGDSPKLLDALRMLLDAAGETP
jgi:hypothetical protein